MSIPAIAILIGIIVFLVIRLEKERGVAEPYVVDDLKKAIERQTANARSWQDLCDKYREASEDALKTIDKQEAEINELKNKKPESAVDIIGYNQGYDTGYKTALEADRAEIAAHQFALGYFEGYDDGLNNREPRDFEEHPYEL